MSEIYIVGVAMTPFGKYPESTVKQLTRDAVAGALNDAGCDIADIGAAWFANSGQGAAEGDRSERHKRRSSIRMNQEEHL